MWYVQEKKVFVEAEINPPSGAFSSREPALFGAVDDRVNELDLLPFLEMLIRQCYTVYV